MADSANVVEVTDQNFQDITGSSNLSMVDFWAVWCGPCRAVAPIVEQLADEYSGQVTVGKMDVDNNPRVPAQFNVRSIPTILFFKDGNVVDQVIGAVPRPVLENKIRQHLNGAAA
ncbi:thioredoxin [Longimicrobium sp.]|uniref:thioredoxin n=1 Tax=Longimicrobium sp. TaxID=2029185 RepID=UPI002C193A3A|nr:thioredoxin [Longimicrobium sp.]HSU13738.1 thioredoxin [Longimicrobium sp.]